MEMQESSSTGRPRSITELGEFRGGFFELNDRRIFHSVRANCTLMQPSMARAVAKEKHQL